MRRVVVTLFAAIMLGCLVAAGPLFTSIGPAGEWIAAAVPETPDAPAHTSFLERRSPGRLVERATTGRRVAQLSTLGARLAALLEDGAWALVSSTGLAPSPQLPNGGRPQAIAGDGDGLLFVEGSSLWRFDGRTFARAGEVPERPATASGVRMLAARDLLLFAWIEDAAVRLRVRNRGGDWRAAPPLEAQAFWLIDDERAGPSIVTRSLAGEWRRRSVAADARFDDGVALDAGPLGAMQAVSVSGVSGELRLTADDGKALVEQTIDASGRPAGPARPLSLVAAPTGTPLFDQLMRVASFVAIAFVLFAGRRGDGEVAPQDRPTPARVGGRAVAGLIDAWPLYAAVAVAVFGTPAEVWRESGLESPRVQWSLLAGVASYIVINGASELFSGRTLGKLVFGLRVVSLDGSPPTARAVLIRNALRLLDLNLFLLLLVPMSTLRQRLGDIVAQTLVIEAPPKSRRQTADKEA